MDYNNFLEKPECQKIKIIKWLIFNPENCSKKIIQQDLDLSPQTLQLYMNDIRDEIASKLHFNFSIIETDESITLEKSDLVNLNHIIYYYLKKSYKYRIMVLLLEKGKVTHSQFEKELSVSRSTVYRKIVEMNTDLSAFQLEIQNGRIVGSELQIRYFYFLFFTSLTPFETLVASMTNSTILTVISSLESELGSPFSIEGKAKLYIWMQVVFKRYHTNAAFNYARDSEIISFFQQAFFYRRFERILKKIEQEQNFVRNDSDRTYMFAASLSFSFFPMFFNDYLQWGSMSEGSSQLSFKSLDSMIKAFLIKNYNLQILTVAEYNLIRFLVIQAVLQYAFFEGYLFSYDENQFQRSIREQPNHSFSEKAGNFISHLKELIQHSDNLRQTDEDPQLRNLHYHISAIFRYIELQTERKLRVGFRSHAEFLVQLLMKAMWERYLNNDIPVHLELFSEGESYDLIISDYRTMKDEENEVYLISDLNTNYDINQIKAKLRTLYKQNEDHDSYLFKEF